MKKCCIAILCLLGLVLVSVIAYFVYSNYKKSTNCCKVIDASGYCGANPNFMDKPGSDNVPSQTCLPCPSKCTLQQCETDSLQENSDTDSYFKDCVNKCMPSIRLCDMLENAACGQNNFCNNHKLVNPADNPAYPNGVSRIESVCTPCPADLNDCKSITTDDTSRDKCMSRCHTRNSKCFLK